MFFTKKIEAIETLAFVITQFSVAIVASFAVKGCSKFSNSQDAVIDLNLMNYIGIESFSSWLFILSFLKASEKKMGDLEGSLLVAGSALVGIQATEHFTTGVLNPTVALAL